MEITIIREWPKSDYTIGKFFVNGVRICESLEDTDRGLSDSMALDKIKSAKVYGKTAIPKGKYEVTMAVSQKFKNRVWAKPNGGKVPTVLGVKGFAGILIHPGTDANDTLGCIIVGKNTKKGMLTSSQATYRRLVDEFIVPSIARGEKIYLEIK